MTPPFGLKYQDTIPCMENASASVIHGSVVQRKEIVRSLRHIGVAVCVVLLIVDNPDSATESWHSYPGTTAQE